MKERTTMIPVYLPRSVIAALDKEAKRRKISRSRVILSYMDIRRESGAVK